MNMQTKVTANSPTMGLDERAILVKLTVKLWSNRKTDQEVTDEIISQKEAQHDSGEFRKRLLKHAAMQKVYTVAGAIRASHYEQTLPWMDGGPRIIAIERYKDYTDKMRGLRKELQVAIDELIEQYDVIVAEEPKRLKKLFNADDYPTKEELRKKFIVDIETMPVPVAKDFRAKVSDAETNAIIKDMEKRNKERLKLATKDTFARVAKLVGRMAEKLEGYKPREGLHKAESTFRDSLVENIRELADILPSMNLAGDPELTKIHKDLVEHLCKYDADELRADVKARQVTAKKANQIYNKVSQYLA